MAVIARMVYHCYGWLDHSCWANAQLLWLAGHLKCDHKPGHVVFLVVLVAMTKAYAT